MSADEIAQWLAEGIEDLELGRRAEARELFMKVVQADEKNQKAWLWLSGVVTTLEDREVCLENALALDPTNESVLRDLQVVRAQIAATPEVEPESTLHHLESDANLPPRVSVDFSEDEFSDPLTCVYCGYLTKETDKHCPQCKRQLTGSFYKRDQPRWLWVAVVICIAAALFTAGNLLLLTIIFSTSLSVGQPQGAAVDFVQILLFYLGQASRLTPQTQTLLFSVLPREVFYVRLAYVVLAFIVSFGLLTRKRVFYILYIAMLAVAVVGVVLNAQLSQISTVLPPNASALERILGVVVDETAGVLMTVTGWIAGGLLLAQVVMAFLIEGDFEKTTERYWSAIDPSVHDATGAFMRARTFMKREMWVMAVRYLQRAISIAPNTFEYYLALAESYARLERYQQSLRMLDQAALLQSDSVVVENLRGVILELQARKTPTAPPDEQLPPLPDLTEDYDDPSA